MSAKRFFDFLLALVTLVVLSPLLLVVALCVWLFIGRPVLFVQTRPGYKTEPFALIKFRSMSDARDPDGNLLPDAQRLCGFGRFLRASSLDELPELWNVLRGQMSLVGPRPLLMEYVPLSSPDQLRRHDALPGITGWAQVQGRNAISWEERFALDVWYVDNRSLWLDLRILWMTVGRVLKREGIAHGGDATMPKFKGTPK